MTTNERGSRPSREPCIRLWFLLCVFVMVPLLIIGASILFAEVQTVPWIANGSICISLALLLFLALIALFSRWPGLHTHPLSKQE